MAKIQIKNINQGGIADSEYAGLPDSLAEIVGLNVHGKSGLIKVNQALTDIDTESIINDEIHARVSSSDGNQYLFGYTNGSLWRREGSTGILSFVVSLPDGVKGAEEYQGYIYYAMQGTLGRVAVGNPTNWANRDDNFATFANGDADWHPMKKVNRVLFIGDGHYVSQVDSSLVTINYSGLTGSFVGGEEITGGTSGATALVEIDDGSGIMQVKETVGVFVSGEVITGAESGATATTGVIVDGTFSDNALDIAIPLRIKCLGQLGTDLLIGTFINDNINATEILRWNTWSPSFTNSDPIPEIGINAFLEADNFVIVSAGMKGRLYTYNGSQLDEYKQIIGNWDLENKATVNPNATINFNGLPLFGLSTIGGDPAIMGVYSLARTNSNYPYVLITEYLTSKLNKKNLVIGSLTYAGDVFIVTWKDTNGGKIYGVDVLDLTKKHPNAYLTTRISLYDRFLLGNYNIAQIAHKPLPEDTGFIVRRSVNHRVFEAMGDLRTDVTKNISYTKDNIGDACTVQMQLEFVVNENNAPEVELFEYEVDKQ